MADDDNHSDRDRFLPSVLARPEPYPLKGAGGLDWGMQSWLARVFRPADGRAVMLAIDHGKKLPELDALTTAYRAVEEGAAGVDMGRNIFQSDNPVAMIRAVSAVVHDSLKPQEAYGRFLRRAPVMGDHDGRT
jgi:hypothetical protein